MQSTKRKVLEAAGWKFGDAADFLAMTNDERQMLDLRVEAAGRSSGNERPCRLSQQQLAERLKTSQPRIVKIEHAAPDVTLDQILRAFTAAGGRISLLIAALPMHLWPTGLNPPFPPLLRGGRGG